MPQKTAQQEETDRPQKGTDTGDYSATKAPENREHVESKTTSMNPSQEPPTSHGVTVEVGMSGLHRSSVPSMANDTQELDASDEAKDKRTKEA